MNHSTPLTGPLRTVIAGKYRLEEVLGSGATGTVYRATHTWTERQVALKLLSPTLANHGSLRERFLREARASVRLHHPNVVDVLDMGETEDESIYMAMDLLHGDTLRAELQDVGALTPERTLFVLTPLLAALELAHDKGVVHRDLKPENIMLSVDENGLEVPKILDFGVAKLVSHDVKPQTLTLANGIVGTPHYMSPEQASGERDRVGPHTDVWAMGVILYECLTGRKPFHARSIVELLRKICEEQIDFAAVPPVFRDVLEDALSRDPARRIMTMAELRLRMEDPALLKATVVQGAVRRDSGIVPAARTRSQQPPVSADLPKGAADHRKYALLVASAFLVAGVAATGWRLLMPSSRPVVEQIQGRIVAMFPEDNVEATAVAAPAPVDEVPMVEEVAAPQAPSTPVVVKPAPDKRRSRARRAAPVEVVAASPPVTVQESPPAPPPPKSKTKTPPRLMEEW